MPPTPKRVGLVITNEFNLFHIWIILGLVSELACFWSLSGQPPAHPPMSGEEKVWWRASHGLESDCSSNRCGLHTYPRNSNVIFLSKYPHLYFPQGNRSFCCISTAYANILTLTISHVNDLGRSLNLYVPAPSFMKWVINSTYLIGYLCGLNESMHVNNI